MWCVMLWLSLRFVGCVSVGYEVGVVFFFQAEDGIRDLVRSRGLGDVYKRQQHEHQAPWVGSTVVLAQSKLHGVQCSFDCLDIDLSLIHI